MGLLEIGRRWGHSGTEAPGEPEAREFLDAAYAAGVRAFDTAPSYALSERRLGAFLGTLGARERADVTVATKFGETWNFDAGAPDVDHRYDTLMRSLEDSLALLGQIDILQVHKATPQVLRDPGVIRATEAALAMGVGMCGASLKDLDTAEAACESDLWGMIQVPFNREAQGMLWAIEEAARAGRMVFTNRPFGEGRLLVEGATPAECIASIAQVPFDGAILFGTRSVEHLRTNRAAFELAFPMPGRDRGEAC